MDNDSKNLIDNMAAVAIPMVAWQFVPSLATQAIQAIWYGITISAGDRKPQPGTSLYAKHHRRIRIVVISLYLLFTIYEADYEIRKASDFYQDLGISHNIDERGIKQRFRRLAALHHPDKVSPSNTSAERYFVHLKLAQDTLMNPITRFAYERFGPEISQWRDCASIHEYVVRSAWETFRYYIFGAVVLYLFGIMGVLAGGLHWRWFTLVSLCIFEFHILTRPYFPAAAENLINPLITTFSRHPPFLPFQLTTLLRRMAITLSIALSQLGPLIQSSELRKAQTDPELLLKQSLNHVFKLAKEAEVDTTNLMGLEIVPFAGNPQAISDAKTKVKDWLIQNTIRNDPDVRDAMGRTMQRRRADAPVGARGNR